MPIQKAASYQVAQVVTLATGAVVEHGPAIMPVIVRPIDKARSHVLFDVALRVICFGGTLRKVDTMSRMAASKGGRQEIEPIGLRAFLVEPGSFRTGIEQRTRFSGEPIEAYEATSGAFRKMMTTVSPDMFPGRPSPRRRCDL